jgi:hypothetical protein
MHAEIMLAALFCDHIKSIKVIEKLTFILKLLFNNRIVLIIVVIPSVQKLGK